jgi:hypothetical protein
LTVEDVAMPGHDQSPIRDGHDSQRIWHNGRYIEYYRYVFAEALGIDPDDIPDNMYIHHIDGDRMNNNIDNLMLCTKKAHENLETLIDPKKYTIK